MPNEKILILLADPSVGSMLERAALKPAGFTVTLSSDLSEGETLLKNTRPDLLILGDTWPDENGLEIGAGWIEQYPAMPVILLALKPVDNLPLQALRLGYIDCLLPPLKINDLVQAVQKGVQWRKHLQDWATLETRRGTRLLQQRVEGLEALQSVGRSVTSLLDLDAILTAVVDAAVKLTGAEEGSLLLLDEATGDLYMRAARNFQEDFVRTFRLPIHDTMAGQVVRSGKPLVINETSPKKIKTAYLVHTLIYVPLQVHGRVIGVLGVDNRQSGAPFSEDQQILVSTLADYAAIAIENARTYSRIEQEHTKLETILTQVEEAVIVVDHDGRLVLANQTARNAFQMAEGNLVGRPIADLVSHAELLEIFEEKDRSSMRCELKLEDGRTFNAQVTAIQEVGKAVTMQDITHLKELDRIKSDFVSTVSHDLRSPLTAILGYIELMERVGPVSDQQRDFIRRIQASVYNITSLINDLLELGRIEAGFDARKDVVPVRTVIQFAVDGLQDKVAQKKQHLVVNMPAGQPMILGNAVHLRQMVSNMIANASLYTQTGGQIQVNCRVEAAQVILQVIDNGPGIPPADQPYVFDKFYRASNVGRDIPGTGLGLAIVKSIVDDHQGRIWVESVLGQGTCFTVVLPATDNTL